MRNVVCTQQRDWDDRIHIFLLAFDSNPRDCWRDTCQNGVRARDSSVLPSDVRGSPDREQSTTDYIPTMSNDGTTSIISPVSTWIWPVTGWRRAMTSCPNRLDFKNAAGCGEPYLWLGHCFFIMCCNLIFYSCISYYIFKLSLVILNLLLPRVCYVIQIQEVVCCTDRSFKVINGCKTLSATSDQPVD
jgi:hypothetical protein